MRGHLRGLHISPELFESVDNPEELFERLRRKLGPGADADGVEDRLERFRRHFQQIEERIQERLKQLEEAEPETALQSQSL